MQTTTTTSHDGPRPADTPPRDGATPRPPDERDRHRTVRAAIVAAALLVAVTAILWAIARPIPDQPVEPTTSAAVSDDEALRRLIARGYVPGDAHDAEAELTRALHQRGLVPDGVTVPPPLHTPDEQAVLRLVRAGVLPDEVLRAEVFVTKELINRGLVPPGSAR